MVIEFKPKNPPHEVFEIEVDSVVKLAEMRHVDEDGNELWTEHICEATATAKP